MVAPDDCAASTTELGAHCARPPESWWPVFEKFHQHARAGLGPTTKTKTETKGTTTATTATTAAAPMADGPRPAVASAGTECPAEWLATCPSQPCTPLPPSHTQHQHQKKQIMGWRARWSTPMADAGDGCMDDCASNSWTHYINNTALTSVIIATGLNQTQVGS